MRSYSIQLQIILLLKFQISISKKKYFKNIWNSCHISMGLTHWGRVTHICVSNLTIIRSDNGLSPGRCQAIIWTNARILLIGPLGTNFSDILIEILTCSFKKRRLKVSSAKWRPFCLGLNVLISCSENQKYQDFLDFLSDVNHTPPPPPPPQKNKLNKNKK